MAIKNIFSMQKSKQKTGMRSVFAATMLALALSACASSAKPKRPVAPTGEQSGPTVTDEEVGSSEIAINTESPLANQGTNVTTGTVVPTAGESKICLVLGPGMARGFAHAGVIEAFHDAQIKIHCIVGVEMGAIVGALYSDSQNANTLQWQLFKLKKDVYLDVPMFSLKNRTAAGDKLAKILSDSLVGRRVRDLRLPFTPIATEESSGNPYAFGNEPAAEAVMASAAISGVFRSRMVAGKGPFVSGMSSSPYGIREARELGGTHFVVVDLLGDAFTGNQGDGFDAEIAKQFLVAKNLGRFQKTDATLVVSPDLHNYGFTDFDRRAEIISIGKRSGIEAAQRLKAILAPKVEEAK